MWISSGSYKQRQLAFFWSSGNLCQDFFWIKMAVFLFVLRCHWPYYVFITHLYLHLLNDWELFCFNLIAEYTSNRYIKRTNALFQRLWEEKRIWNFRKLDESPRSWSSTFILQYLTYLLIGILQQTWSWYCKACCSYSPYWCWHWCYWRISGISHRFKQRCQRKESWIRQSWTACIWTRITQT